jgi:hypothetical protein
MFVSMVYGFYVFWSTCRLDTLCDIYIAALSNSATKRSLIAHFPPFPPFHSFFPHPLSVMYNAAASRAAGIRVRFFLAQTGNPGHMPKPSNVTGPFLVGLGDISGLRTCILQDQNSHLAESKDLLDISTIGKGFLFAETAFEVFSRANSSCVCLDRR